MKKLFAILGVLVLFVAITTFAQDGGAAPIGAGPEVPDGNNSTEYRESYSQSLVDFTVLDPEDDESTKVEYGNAFGSFLSEEELAKLTMSFALKEWRAAPQSSIEFPDVFQYSFVKGVEVTGGPYAGEVVLGVRLLFPDYPFEMWTSIQPPFIPDTTSDAFDGKGVVKNIGLVRSAYITVYGLNQPERVYLTMEDSVGNEYEYSFGDLKFMGWKQLEWVNPNYLEDLRAREIRDLPLYPQASSNRRLTNIKYRRSPIHGTNDFVTYIRDIRITYDRAIDESLLNDIDNEAVWGLMSKRVSFRDSVAFSRSLQKRYIRYLEERKKYDYGDVQADGQGGAAPAPAPDGQGGAAPAPAGQ